MARADARAWGAAASHVATLGALYQRKREAILLDNCRRFVGGEPLLNVVDKAN